jgi:hypothetical protein
MILDGHQFVGNNLEIRLVGEKVYVAIVPREYIDDAFNATDWKQFYLDNKDSFDGVISAFLNGCEAAGTLNETRLLIPDYIIKNTTVSMQ